MAVGRIAAYQFEWRPRAERLMAKLGVEDAGREAFEAALSRAKAAYMPRAWAREVSIEALGDDFVYLSGEWFEGWEVAAALSRAERVWVFAASAGGGPPPQGPEDEPEAGWIVSLGGEAMAVALEGIRAAIPRGEGESVAAIAPGLFMGWPIVQREPLLRLLESGETCAPMTAKGVFTADSDIVGLLFTEKRPPCACGGCASGNCFSACAGRMQ